jgi:phage terminase large subunit-like protein
VILEVVPPQQRGITFNASQQDAVDHREGPCLVLAGPGSGKTRVIVERVVTLAQEGVPLDQILVLTFTIGAVQEMLDWAVAALSRGSATFTPSAASCSPSRDTVSA